MHGACGALPQSWTVSASAQGKAALWSAQQAHHIPALHQLLPHSITHYPAPFHRPTANILNGSAVTVLLPVVADIPKFVSAAERQRVFTPRQAAAELAAYTLPLGRAAITTVNQGRAVHFAASRMEGACWKLRWRARQGRVTADIAPFSICGCKVEPTAPHGATPQIIPAESGAGPPARHHHCRRHPRVLRAGAGS